MVFHWSLSDSKSPQVSWILLSILAVLNNVVVWMVSTCPLTSKSSSPFGNPLVTVPKAQITIGIIITCLFHSFFNSLARSRYLSFFSYSFSFILWSAGQQSRQFYNFSFFLLIIIRSGLLLLLLLLLFSHQRKLMVFHWRLSDSKSPQFSRTLLSILVVFSNAVVCMVSTRPPTSKSSGPFNNPLVTVTKAPITTGIIVTFMFHSYFSIL